MLVIGDGLQTVFLGKVGVVVDGRDDEAVAEVLQAQAPENLVFTPYRQNNHKYVS